jgi:hypothetical protein
MPRRPKAKPSRSHKEATVEGPVCQSGVRSRIPNSTREWRKVAVLGYCLGGLMVFLTAVRYGGIAARNLIYWLTVVGVRRGKAALPSG